MRYRRRICRAQLVLAIICCRTSFGRSNRDRANARICSPQREAFAGSFSHIVIRKRGLASITKCRTTLHRLSRVAVGCRVARSWSKNCLSAISRSDLYRFDADCAAHYLRLRVKLSNCTPQCIITNAQSPQRPRYLPSQMYAIGITSYFPREHEMSQEARLTDVVAAINQISARLDGIEQKMSTRLDGIEERMSSLQRTVHAIEAFPIPYGRPKTFEAATEYHSATDPKRRRLGHMG